MKIYIKTYGCQMNERDSEACAGVLTNNGYIIVSDEAEADVLIFNTCSVREQAERKAIGKIGFVKRNKKKNPDLLIGVMGCMAQNFKEKLWDEVPHVDFIIGTGQLHKLPEIINSLAIKRHRTALLEESDEVLESMEAHYSLDPNPIFAYIAITRGCNRFCSYCIVPYVRGREISRTIESIVKEAEAVVAAGAKEIMLLGQNVAAFGLNGLITPPPPDISPFADLLTELSKIENLKRIRFTSPYPSYFNQKLIAAVCLLPKVCRHIHLPLQSGSDRILKLMNRQYSASEYLQIVAALRSGIPDITFSTDVIVGFPGETEADFNATREIMEKVDFDNAYIFKYSPRSGTVSAEMADDVTQEVKEARNQILLSDLEQRSLNHNLALVGTEQEVLIEGESKRNKSRWSGKNTNGKTVIFTPTDGMHRGDLVNIAIVRASAVSLFGHTTD
jgi:tRNA-2-methylthio-N6-dimethylallyladenosine synthase